MSPASAIASWKLRRVRRPPCDSTGTLISGVWLSSHRRSALFAATLHEDGKFFVLPHKASYLAAAGKAGSLATSRASCWMMTVALVAAAIFFTRSSEASVSARLVLNGGTPSLS